ncbi:MAG: ATP-binding protein [Chloroflexota bacterium]
MPERIVVLHGITAAMLRILDLDRLLPEIVRAATALETADAASVMLPSGDGAALRIVAHHGLSDEYAATQRIPIEAAKAMYEGFDSPLELDLRVHPLGDPALIAREGLVRVIAMPLVQEGALIGGINVYTKDAARTFDRIDIEILHILAAQASVAITNARLYAEERTGRRLQESLLESLGDSVVIAFPDGTMRMNRAARELLGVDEQAAFDWNEYRKGIEVLSEEGDLLPAGETPMDRALRGIATAGVFISRDTRRGTNHVLRVRGQPVHGANGTVVAGVVSMHDLTVEREAERQKDEFLSIVSHELKTPLTPLKALAQLMRLRLRRHREDGRAFDLDSLDANLKTIERQVDRMSGLVNDLLEVSRAGQGHFELQPQEFDLVPLVREVVHRHDELAAEDGRHRFTVDAPDAMVINGDSMRIEQALTNLVGNAVKYSPSGGDVRIAVAQRNGAASVTVTDQGIGIDPGDIAGLGKPFARGSSRARTFSGMGIGLYLARLVAERHGGSITLHSAGEDKGTTVTMELPREGATKT